MTAATAMQEGRTTVVVVDGDAVSRRIHGVHEKTRATGDVRSKEPSNSHLLGAETIVHGIAGKAPRIIGPHHLAISNRRRSGASRSNAAAFMPARVCFADGRHFMEPLRAAAEAMEGPSRWTATGADGAMSTAALVAIPSAARTERPPGCLCGGGREAGRGSLA